ncbi:MAG TPA: hypothetical protein VHC18_08445, partial [Amycolatopsis sp.]|nr:hypothetical protein [Amycolatopsis sp.]
IDALTTLLHRAAATGDLRPDVEPGKVARYLVGAFTGVHLLSEVLTSRRDVAERVEDMWEILLRSVVPEDKLSYFLQVSHTYAEREHATR